MRSLPLKRRRFRFSPPSDEPLLGLGEQGSFHLGQGSLLEGFDRPFDPVEGVQVTLEPVRPPSRGLDGVAFVVFEYEADAGHAGSSPSAIRRHDEANLPPRAITGKWTAGKKFAEKVEERLEERAEHSNKPLKVLAFDEARFGLINWHRKRYCPKGFRPPYIVRRAYEWTYLYAAVDPTTGESLCLYLPGMDSLCFQMFLERLGEAYADHHLVVVLDGAPSHTSSQITLPENVSLMALAAYSPELNPVERWFQEFRRALSNRIFETVELLQEAITDTLEPYWKDLARLRRLVGFSWWVEAIESLGHH